MTLWTRATRAAAGRLRRWRTVLLLGVLSVFVLPGSLGVSWSGVVLFVFGLYGAHLIAEDAVAQWVERVIAPGMPRGLSLAHPRVWTFTLDLMQPFLDEVAAQLAARLAAHPGATRLPPSLQRSWHATAEFLQKLVIDEHPGRVRVHLWLVADAAPYVRRYEWFDLAPDSTGRFADSRGRCLWAYAAADTVGGSLSLSGSWERDAGTRHAFFQLTLWVDHDVVRSRTTGAKEIPPTDLLCHIPLEPRQLYEEPWRKVAVQGDPRRSLADDDPMFPYPEDTWEYEADNGSPPPWSWHLHMRTFLSGLTYEPGAS